MVLERCGKEFDVPGEAIQLGEKVCGKGEVVVQKNQPISPQSIPVADTAEPSRITLGRIKPAQSDGLIALHAAVLVDGMRDESGKAKVLAWPGGKKGAIQCPGIKPFEV